MKIADLKVGVVYAVGTSGSSHLKTAGMLLSTDYYSDRRTRYVHDETRSFTLAPESLARHSTAQRGLLLATISQYADAKEVAALAKVDPAEIRLVPGSRQVRSVSVFVQVVQPRMILKPWADWNVERIAAEQASRKAKLAEQERRVEREETMVKLRELCEELGLPKPSGYADRDLVNFFDRDELLVALTKLTKKT